MVKYWLVWVGMVFIMVGMIPWSPGTLVPWSPGVLVGYLSFQRSKWAGGKNLRKNLVFWPTFIFWSILSDTLVPWSPWVTRHTGGLSQLSVVKMSWEKNFKKKPSVLTNFCFLVNFVRHTGPMVTMVTRYTGGLSQLPVVEMSWEKNSKKKPSVHNIFCFLDNFIRHTGPMVTMGHLVHRCFIYFWFLLIYNIPLSSKSLANFSAGA